MGKSRGFENRHSIHISDDTDIEKLRKEVTRLIEILEEGTCDSLALMQNKMQAEEVTILDSSADKWMVINPHNTCTTRTNFGKTYTSYNHSVVYKMSASEPIVHFIPDRNKLGVNPAAWYMFGRIISSFVDVLDYEMRKKDLSLSKTASIQVPEVINGKYGIYP